MIWTFKKRKPAIPFEEYATTLPTPPCGDNVTHYEWEMVNGMVCPKCHADWKRREKDAELDRLADKIVALLRVAPGVPSTSEAQQ